MKRPVATILCAATLDVGGGVAFAGVEHRSIAIGLYWAVTTATTTGYGDVTPHTPVGHLIAVLVMLTVVPLFAATFSLLTSGLTAKHVRAEGAQARRRLDHIIRHHPQIPDLPSGATRQTKES